jgi:pilus assembly protein CpaE
MPDAGHAVSHRTLRVLMIADEAERDALRAALAGVTEPHLETSEIAPGAPARTAVKPTDVVIFVFHKERKPAVSDAAVAGHERPVRIALVHERSTQTIREALRAGADEVLFLPLDSGDLARALLKISETRRLPEAVVSGRLISLVSVTGGAGVTTMAANLGLALAHSAGKKVALVDLDFQSGDLAVALNLEPERSILDLNDPNLRLNSVQIESALTRHPSGVYLLAAPARIEESEQIPSAQVGAVLDLMRQMVDVVIVDIGRHIGDVSVVVWERSDELLYVLDQSIGAMRGAWRFLDLFGRLNLAGVQPKFILNRWAAHHPISEKHIVNTLGRPLAGRMPRDDKALEQALSRGEDLWKAAPRSPLTRGYEALAHQISDVDRGKRKRAGLLSKIFARNGARPRS